MEPRFEEWWNARMSDVQYQLGHLDEAVEHARKVKGKFYEKLVERMGERKAEWRRTLLPVGFVRQQRDLRAGYDLRAQPFREQAIDHLSLAASICEELEKAQPSRKRRRRRVRAHCRVSLVIASAQELGALRLARSGDAVSAFFRAYLVAARRSLLRALRSYVF